MILKTKIILAIISFLVFFETSPASDADTIILKNGTEIEADIMEKTNEYVKISIEGVEVKYYADEIDRVYESEIEILKQGTFDSTKRRTPSINLAESSSDNFLWKILSEDNTVYILGSIHLGVPELYPLAPEIKKAFEASDVLAVEADVSKGNPLNNMGLLSKALYPEGKTLKQSVSSDTYKMAKEKLQELSLPIELLAKYKPWFLAITLETLQLTRLGFSPQYGIDFHFLQKARGDKKIVELESATYQIGLLNSFSPQEQEKFLEYTLKEINILGEKMEVIIKAWKAGDGRKIRNLLNFQAASESDLSAIYEKMFYSRNRKMVDKIQGYLQQNQDYFVIVGAGHLVGDKGILYYLEKEGYSTQQM